MLPCTRIHVQCINFIVSNFDSIALQHCTSSLDVDQTHGHSDTHSLSHNVSFDHHDMKYNGTRFTIKSVVLIEYSFQTSSNSPLIDKSMRCVVHSIIFFLINNVQFHCSLMQKKTILYIQISRCTSVNFIRDEQCRRIECAPWNIHVMPRRMNRYPYHHSHNHNHNNQ